MNENLQVKPRTGTHQTIIRSGNVFFFLPICFIFFAIFSPSVWYHGPVTQPTSDTNWKVSCFCRMLPRQCFFPSVFYPSCSSSVDDAGNLSSIHGCLCILYCLLIYLFIFCWFVAALKHPVGSILATLNKQSVASEEHYGWLL